MSVDWAWVIAGILLLPVIGVMAANLSPSRPAAPATPPSPPPVPPPNGWGTDAFSQWEFEWLYNMDPDNPAWLRPWHEAFEQEVADGLIP